MTTRSDKQSSTTTKAYLRYNACCNPTTNPSPDEGFQRPMTKEQKVSMTTRSDKQSSTTTKAHWRHNTCCNPTTRPTPDEGFQRPMTKEQKVSTTTSWTSVLPPLRRLRDRLPRSPLRKKKSRHEASVGHGEACQCRLAFRKPMRKKPSTMARDKKPPMCDLKNLAATALLRCQSSPGEKPL